MNINEVTIKQIESLSDIQLTKLLHTLLQIEVQKNLIVGENIFVPFNITTGDAGDDGRVYWTSGPVSTKWLKNRFCLFQNKATVLEPAGCYQEILRQTAPKTTKELKPLIKELVEANGCYILFTNKSINTNGKEKRVKKFREAIKDAGHTNYASIIIEVYDTNSIKDWVNENIAAVTLVQAFNEITRKGFRTWEEWEKTLDGHLVPFKSNDYTRQNIATIINTVKTKTPFRIIGHSGIGKTRLVLEAFRSKSVSDEIEAFKKQLVYYEIGIDGDLTYLVNYITSHTSQTGILIIDSCDEKAHKALSGLIASISKFSLITIDISTSTDEESYFKIDRDDQREIVKDIIDEILGSSHSQSDRDYLNNICEGYPWMAVRFCASIQKRGINDFSGTLPKDFIRRLLFSGSNEDELQYSVIRACSVFSTFGFLDDELRLILNRDKQRSLEEQSNYIRTVVYDGEISEEKFYEICQKYKGKDIIEKRGTQYIVKPTILAINLASDWLLHTPPSKIIKILEDLKGQPLSHKFVERLSDLDQLDKAQQIVHELWGPRSPFGSAEVLNTEWGSLLFRYVVEVNPIITASSLTTAYGKLSKIEIYNIKEGRRNLVRALEKLCFRKESFITAAKILYSFAVSENETWGNNSTHQFIQLYQLFLSGTEANLFERIEVIKYGLLKSDDDYDRVAIQALGRAIFNDQYSRMGGAEKQGSRAPLIDYQPSVDEIYQYWKSSIQILTEFASGNGVNSDLAREKLATAYRTLIRDGLIEDVILSINAVFKSSQQYWIEGINSLKRTIAFEENLPENTVERVKNLISSFSVDNIKDQLFIKVSVPDWDSYEKDEDDKYINKPKINAEHYAEYLINEEADWLQYLPDLLQGEQRQGFVFGSKIGELSVNKFLILKEVFIALDNIPDEKINVEFIGGFIYGAKSLEVNDFVINALIEKKTLNKYAFYLTRIIGPKYSDLEKLFSLIDNNSLTIKLFSSFQYGRALEKLTSDEVILLCKKISSYGKQGKWIALSLIFMYTYNDEKKWDECEAFISDLISSENLLITSEEVDTMDSYHWSTCVERILLKKNYINFAKSMMTQIIGQCSTYKINHSFDHYLHKTLVILLENYFETVWPLFGEGLTGDYLTFINLRSLMSDGVFFRKSGFFNSDVLNEKILKWVREKQSNAPERIANIMPIYQIGTEEIKWHPFAETIINEFGNNEDVLRQLTANMGTFAISGSSVPHFMNQKVLLMLLSNHPFMEVREWVENMLEYTEKNIKLEKLNDEESTI